MAKISPFEYWKVINGQKKFTDELKQSFDSDYDIFMINRIVSHDARLLKFFFEQPNSMALPKSVHFEILREFYQATYGKQSIFIDFFKKEAADKEVELISDHYNVSLTDAVNYRQMISDDELGQLLDAASDRENYLNAKTKITKQKRKTK